MPFGTPLLNFDGKWISHGLRSAGWPRGLGLAGTRVAVMLLGKPERAAEVLGEGEGILESGVGEKGG